MPDIRIFSANYENCKDELIAFRNTNRDTKRDLEYFEWRYTKRPSGISPLIVWAGTDKGGKIGSLSLFLHHYIINNVIHPLGVLGDISVAKEWRGKGIAKQMFNYLLGLEYVKKIKACIVLPNEDAAKPLKKTNWQTISKMERYVKLINLETRINQRLKSNSLSNIVTISLNSVIKLLSLESYLKEPNKYKGELSVVFDQRFDELWDNLNKDGMIIGLRNKVYLTWRYQKHPIINYLIFTLTNNLRLYGYIIFHIEKNKLYVDDILCFNSSHFSTYLLVSFLKFVKNNWIISSISLKINKNDLMRFPLFRFGFIKRSDYQKFMIIHNCSADETSFLSNGSRWYLTSGDKDV